MHTFHIDTSESSLICNWIQTFEIEIIVTCVIMTELTSLTLFSFISLVLCKTQTSGILTNEQLIVHIQILWNENSRFSKYAIVEYEM